jgi:hypothetical protein
MANKSKARVAKACARRDRVPNVPPAPPIWRHTSGSKDELSKDNERSFMMNGTYGWMSGWMGGGMWIYTVIGVLLVVLLVVVITKLSNKKA